MNCTECHLDTAKDIHPVKYLWQDATYSTLNTSAVTCITCHQTTSVDSKLILTPPKIPLHKSLSCTNCHTQGHKNMGARKAYEDCHAVQANPITDKDRSL